MLLLCHLPAALLLDAADQASRLAVSRARPPLAAPASVLAARQGPCGSMQGGGWPSHYHLAAAVRERAFWAKVRGVRGLDGLDGS